MNTLPDAALFDLDGVLVDTETKYTEIWRDIEKVYPTGIPNFALAIKGMTLAQILDQYFPDRVVREGVCNLLKDCEDSMTYDVFDGVLDFLEQIDAAGVPSVVVTSSNDAKMARLSAMHPVFMSHFRALVTDSCVTHSKPHPEPYLRGAAMVGVDSSRCIVFEDSFSGMAAGRAAGAAVVGLATTNPRESIVGKADVVIDGFGGLTFADVLDMLSAAGRSF